MELLYNENPAFDTGLIVNQSFCLLFVFGDDEREVAGYVGNRFQSAVQLFIRHAAVFDHIDFFAALGKELFHFLKVTAGFHEDTGSGRQGGMRCWGA